MHTAATAHQVDSRSDRLREALAAAVEDLNGEFDPGRRIDLRLQVEELRDALRLLENRETSPFYE